MYRGARVFCLDIIKVPITQVGSGAGWEWVLNGLLPPSPWRALTFIMFGIRARSCTRNDAARSGRIPVIRWSIAKVACGCYR